MIRVYIKADELEKSQFGPLEILRVMEAKQQRDW